MKSNNLKPSYRTGVVLTLLPGAAPITRAYAE